MSAIDTILGTIGLQRKSDDLPLFPYNYSQVYRWPNNTFALPGAQWLIITPQALADFYTTNPVVFACVRVISDSFSQAPLRAYKAGSGTDTEIPNHPLNDLFARPNNLMGQSEFMRYVSTYAAYGGNAYIHMVPNRGGQVGEMWPYNILQMVAVPSQYDWVDHFSFNLGQGEWKDVPTEEVVHVKWAVDVNRPWTGLAPMTAAAQAIQIHSEFTRLRKSLLANDAMPLTAIRMPPDSPPMTPKQRQELKDDFRRLHGGPNYGSVTLLERGADVTRMALNFDELQANDLMAQLEADICASFGIHPIIAKVKLGLDKSTYSNYAEAVHDFTQSNLVPLWESVASEFTNAFQPYFGDGFELHFDLSQVTALQESQDALEARIGDSLNKGLRTLNESRVLLGELPVPDGDVWFISTHIKVTEDLLGPEPVPVPATPAPAATQGPPEGSPEEEAAETPAEEDASAEQEAMALRGPAAMMGRVVASTNGNGKSHYQNGR